MVHECACLLACVRACVRACMHFQKCPLKRTVCVGLLRVFRNPLQAKIQFFIHGVRWLNYKKLHRFVFMAVSLRAIL